MGISSDAITGLVGVATGSVITGGFQYWLARRADRREGRAARRLVARELRNYRAALELATDRRISWHDAAAYLTDDSQWKTYSERLARDLDDGAWDAVDDAYRGQAILGDVLAHLPPSGGEVVSEITGDLLDYVKAALKHLRAGTHRGHVAEITPGDDPETSPGAGTSREATTGIEPV